jgi:glycosyltransferase involved in cell wall biosynthesis
MTTHIKPLKVLLELRPALDRHAGIPQQTRLLFRELVHLESVAAEGLLQSSTHSLGKGVPNSGGWRGPLPKHKAIDRLSRVVIMLEEKFLRSNIAAVPVFARRMLGLSEKLTTFDPTHFRDFIWRRLFARSLPANDFGAVTSAGFRIARAHWTAMHICAFLTKLMGRTIFPRVKTSDFDVMISETPYPARVSDGTALVVRYHDAIPLLMPHTISDRRHHQAFHYRALRNNVESGAWFVCPSDATRRDLVSVFPEADARAITIHNIVAKEYFDEQSDPGSVSHILQSRLNGRIYQRSRAARPEVGLDNEFGYLLVVSTVEPRKNHLNLLAAWERLRLQVAPGLKLVLVGSLGWHHAQIVKRIRPWVEKGEVFMLEDVPSAELRVLYKHARAVVCPSIAEGFDLSGVEAMRCGGAVAASDIPVHREIYGEAAEYFNPYSIDDIGAAIARVVRPESVGRRATLVSIGEKVSQRYTAEAVMPRWTAFLDGIGHCADLPSMEARFARQVASELVAEAGAGEP